MVAVTGVFTEAEFEVLLGKVHNKLGEVQTQARNVTERVNDAVRWMGPLGEGIRFELDRLWSLIKMVWQAITEVLPSPGRPWTLWSYGQTWTGPEIAGRISNLVVQPTLNGIRADDVWQGAAADAYKNTLPLQSQALSALVTAAKNIDDALAQLAIAIGMFWLAILTGLSSYIAELITAGAFATTGVGAAPAAAGASLSTAKVVALISAAVAGLAAFIGASTLPAMKDLAQSLHDRSAFGDQWPPSNNFDMSDGRVSDGDDTDWHLRSDRD